MTWGPVRKLLSRERTLDSSEQTQQASFRDWGVEVGGIEHSRNFQLQAGSVEDLRLDETWRWKTWKNRGRPRQRKAGSNHPRSV